MTNTMESTLLKLDDETRKRISATRVEQRLNICIQGPPGAGKTTIVTDLSKKGHKILYVTLNNSLATYFGKKYEAFKNVFCSTVDSYTYLACIQLLGNIEIAGDALTEEDDMTIKELERYCLKYFDKPLGFGPNNGLNKIIGEMKSGNKSIQKRFMSWPIIRRIAFESEYLTQIISNKIQDSSSKLDFLKTCDLVIVDEAQDLGEFFTMIILKHISPHKTVMWLGDDGQSIYSNTSNIFSMKSKVFDKYFMKPKPNLDHFIQYRLRRSFRLPDSVCKLLRFMGSGSYVGDEQKDDEFVVKFQENCTGQEIPFLFYTNANMFKFAFNYGIKHEQTFKINCFDAKKKNLFTQIQNYEEKKDLCDENVNYPKELFNIFEKKVNSTSVFTMFARLEERMASMKGIDYLLGTIHSFKGAEFEVCRIFTDVWDDVYYRRNTKKKRKLLNVCLSRCTKKVIVDGDVGKELSALHFFSKLPADCKSVVQSFSSHL